MQLNLNITDYKYLNFEYIFKNCETILEKVKELIGSKSHYSYKNSKSPVFEIVSILNKEKKLKGFSIYLTDEYIEEKNKGEVSPRRATVHKRVQKVMHRLRLI